MKPKRRKELRTNELARMLEDAREFLRKYGNYVFGAVVVVVLVGGLGVYWRHARGAAVREGWRQCQAAFGSQQPSPDAPLAQLRSISQEYKDPALVTQALLSLGQLCWRMAMAGPARRSPAKAHELLREAEGAYRRIIDEFADREYAVATAYLSLGAIAETHRRFNEARAYYQAVRDSASLGATPFKHRAEQKLARLDEQADTVIFAPARPRATRPTTLPVTSQPSTLPTTTSAPSMHAVGG